MTYKKNVFGSYTEYHFLMKGKTTYIARDKIESDEYGRKHYNDYDEILVVKTTSYAKGSY